MSINSISLSFVQGDDVTFPVTMTDNNGTAINLTGSTFTADIRKEYTSSVVGSFTFNNLDLINGKFDLVLPTSVTTAMPANRKGRITSFVFDVQETNAAGDKETIILGYLKMQREVTL